jgi:hypothetical protein
MLFALLETRRTQGLVLSKEARVMLLAELELTRVTAARGSGVDVDVEVAFTSLLPPPLCLCFAGLR